jgi:hypothetical protein
MIKRVLAGLAAGIAATIAFGVLAAPEAAAIQDPNTKCVWIWTAGGSGACKKLD